MDEKTLLEALRFGKLGGAALNFYDVKPPKNLKLVQLPQVVCTPHIGGQLEVRQRAASTIIANKIIAYPKDSVLCGSEKCVSNPRTRYITNS